MSYRSHTGLDDREYRSRMGATHSLRQVPAEHTRTSNSVQQTLIAALLSFAAASITLAQAGGVNNPSPMTPPSVLNGTATLVSHYNPNQTLRLAIALRSPHLDEEQQFIKELHDKKSPQFHKFLTADEFNARFAPSVDDEQAVVDWAQSQGLTVSHRYANRLVVDIEAPAGAIEKALNVTLNNYQLGSTTSYSNDREPLVPANLAGVILSIQGLNTVEHVRPASRNLTQPRPPDYTAGPVVATAEPQHFASSKPAPEGTKKPKEGVPAPDITNGNYDPSDLYSSQAYNYGGPAGDWSQGLWGQGHCCNPLGGPSAPSEASIAIAAFGADLDYNDVYSFAAISLSRRLLGQGLR